jgi:hypothetical protein
MRIFFKLLTACFVGLFIVGCSTVNMNVIQQKVKTSKQVEKEIKWKYCEELK